MTSFKNGPRPFGGVKRIFLGHFGPVWTSCMPTPGTRYRIPAPPHPPHRIPVPETGKIPDKTSYCKQLGPNIKPGGGGGALASSKRAMGGPNFSILNATVCTASKLGGWVPLRKTIKWVLYGPLTRCRLTLVVTVLLKMAPLTPVAKSGPE